MNKRRSIKMLAVILIIGLFFFHHAYAQTPPAAPSTLLSDTQTWLSNGVSLLSRVWIFLAIIAGKFMTNDVVYGAFMHLDKYLRAIWNVMKNFANFGLAFMILFSIIKYVIDKKGDDPKKIIVNALMAGVLIQISRFAVGALVDLSTVATSAVAAFPANFIGSNIISTNISTELATMMAKPQKVIKMVNGQVTREDPQPRSDGGSCANTDLDSLMPKYDSVSGPLIFIGMSFFKTQDYMNVGTVPSGDASRAGPLIINFALKLLILLSYVLCLIGLVIANLVRVLFLRVLIMASPVLILMGVFGKGKEGGEGMMKYFNIQTFLDLIFKPVFFIAFLGMTLIFVSSMQQIMGQGKGIQNMQGVSITNTTGSSSIAMNGIASFQVNGDIFNGIADGTKNVFVDLLLIVMTLLLLWYMLKRSISIGGGPVADVMAKLTPFVESLAGNLPITPIGGGMGVKNIREASGASTEKFLEKGLGIKYSGGEKGTFFNNQTDFQNLVNEKFLGINPSWTSEDTTILEKAIEKRDDSFRGKFIDTGERTNGGVDLSNKNQSQLLEKWYKEEYDAGGQGITQKFGVSPGKKATFEDYFKDNDQGKIASLHRRLGGDKALYGNKTTPTTYEGIKNSKYHYHPDKD